MEHVTNAISWFEVPVRDFERARAFYSAIFDYEMPIFPMDGLPLGIFPSGQGTGTVSGAIIQADGHEPSAQGTVVYLNGGSDLSVVLGRVEAAGGKVLQEKMLITEEIGYCAFFADTEGNKLGLHSQG